MTDQFPYTPTTIAHARALMEAARRCPAVSWADEEAAWAYWLARAAGSKMPRNVLFFTNNDQHTSGDAAALAGRSHLLATSAVEEQEYG